MSLSTMNGDGSLVRCLVERLTTRVRRRMATGRPEDGHRMLSRPLQAKDGERTLVLTCCSHSFRTGQAPPAKTSLKMTSFSSPVPPC
jgi:hypothetical protein